MGVAGREGLKVLTDSQLRSASGAGQPMARSWCCLMASVSALALAGCAYQNTGSVEQYFQDLATRLPEKNRVTVCSAYGCRVQTTFRFSESDVVHLRKMMQGATSAYTPAAERAAVAQTLAWMEKRVGDVVGTSADRPGDDLAGGGDPTQMDCVDVATNLTSYLLVLQYNGLLLRHTVGSVTIKEDLRRGFDGWTHYAAVLVETASQQKFAVDGWKLASGKPPEIIEVQHWYIPDTDIVVKG
jgi:hypothetical protein